MATERIDIVVSESGTRTVRRNLEQLGQTASSTEKSFNSLGRVLQGLAAFFTIREVVEFTDAFTNLQNRLKTVTQNTAQLTVTTKKLLDISNQTRQTFTGTVELYSRLATSSKDLGLTQKELFEFTESLNKAVAVSGATSREADNAIIQFSQGLSSGALKGDELRSVLEQLPTVADVIAKQLGVTRGELKKLGESGAISTGVIIEAFKNAREEINDKFAVSVPKVSDAFTILKNNALFLFGQFDQGIGISKTLVSVLTSITSNLETLGRVALAAGIALSVGLAQRGIAVVLSGLLALTSPIRAVLLITSLLVTFADKINLGGGSLANLGDIASAIWESIKAGLNSLISFFSKNFGFISDFSSEVFGDVSFSISGVLKTGAFVIDKLVGVFVGGYNAITRLFGSLPAYFKTVFTDAINSVISIVEKGINTINSAFSEVTEFAGLGRFNQVVLPKLENSARVGSQQLGLTVKEGFLEGFGATDVQDSLQSVLDRADQIAKKRIQEQAALKKQLEEEQNKFGQGGGPSKSSAVVGGGAGGSAGSANGPSFNELLSQLRQESELLKLNNSEREIRYNLLDLESQLNRKLTSEETKQAEQQIRINQSLTEQAFLYDEINAPRESYERGLDSLNKLLESGRISLEDYNQKLQDIRITYLDTKTDLASGVERAFAKIARDAADGASQIETAITNAFSKAEDAFVEFTKTGKLNFSNLVDGILEDLTRLSFRQAITGNLASALGGGISSLFGGGFNPNTAADSRLVSSPSGPVSVSSPGSGGFFSGLSNLFGFANGGQFQVGGQGGTDSQLVAFRASPNETVTVTKPGQQTSTGGDTIIVNITTQDVDSFQRSNGQIMSQFAQNMARTKKRFT